MDVYNLYSLLNIENEVNDFEFVCSFTDLKEMIKIKDQIIKNEHKTIDLWNEWVIRYNKYVDYTERDSHRFKKEILVHNEDYFKYNIKKRKLNTVFFNGLYSLCKDDIDGSCIEVFDALYRVYALELLEKKVPKDIITIVEKYLK